MSPATCKCWSFFAVVLGEVLAGLRCGCFFKLVASIRLASAGTRRQAGVAEVLAAFAARRVPSAGG